ncbi:hypothetical protein A2863_00875 [Candidatus Woesebacteria bacterium RIFCSPHIGHO2_01_FULL_38_9b]|uniref:Alpha/beta hydrolase n=1 Tax=Candidatus Woesebacteria bacterium RIFCSPHIGHO2_01_FULL_38_9b TaxID=1802493 RepID=A0A1F7XYW9_9BACT|nr:MAG: hypothetical protein A2863_00875 [Candidatus Woesebacteria bacterium RIFCSPHIGHO2_01_FULL_38_9b]
MKTIILPGYSEHNRDWAEGIAEHLNLGHKAFVHEWRHWQEKSLSFSLRNETEKILQEVGEDKINIIAKSVGVYVALNLIPKIALQINKVILCGIASVVSEDRAELVKTLTSKIPLENILCIQNENDKFVPFAEAENFYHSVEPKLTVISMPRSDHNYPYSEDFRKFLF